MTDFELQHWRQFLNKHEVLLPEGGADDCSDDAISDFISFFREEVLKLDKVMSMFTMNTDLANMLMQRELEHSNNVVIQPTSSWIDDSSIADIRSGRAFDNIKLSAPPHLWMANMTVDEFLTVGSQESVLFHLADNEKPPELPDPGAIA